MGRPRWIGASGAAVVAAALLIALAVSACRSDPPVATTGPDATPGESATAAVTATPARIATATPASGATAITLPTATRIVPSATVLLFPSPATGPTPTRVIPTATINPGPTSTFAPTFTATATHSPTPTGTPAPTPTPLVPVGGPLGALEAVGDGVVQVRSVLGVGTGVIFEIVDGNSALILTNQHLVGRGLSTIDVATADGGDHTATVVGRDSLLDLAVVRICCSEEFEALDLAPANPSPQDTVWVVGYPLGSANLIATQRTVNFVVALGVQGRTEVQLNGPMNAGTSGGPMLDEFGRLVALNAYRARPSATEIGVEDYGIGVAIESIRGRIADLKSGSTHFVPVPTPCPEVMCGTFTSPLFGYEIEAPELWQINAGDPRKVVAWNPSFGNVVYVSIDTVSGSYAGIDDLLLDRTIAPGAGWTFWDVESEDEIFRTYADSTALTKGHEFRFRFQFEGVEWSGWSHWFLSKTAGSNNLYQVYALAPGVIVDSAGFEQVEQEMRRVLVSFGPPVPF